MASLLAACASGFVPAEAALVVGSRPGTPALLRAEAFGVPAMALDPAQEGYAQRLLDALESARADWVCLAGYMTLLPSAVVSAYPGKILNIHPALLPKFGGKGMYGLRVHEAVLAAGEKESGCTVHFVNEDYDDGPPLYQAKCPVLPDDTPETLAERVLELERDAYPEALRLALAPAG
jgi:formyltetrahydrofolate-dependent phosphoribosylglycinamide formyltransferase